ncbi:MAG TPA: tetratricopeptide repeat protein [Terriglobales bacterium]|nr:tetratricopeptide repeat protein [Terriglobales bacterium]
MTRFLFVLSATILLCACLPLTAQDNAVQVSSPVVHRPPVPDPTASSTVLEMKGDQLRAEKSYLDAMDFYELALKKAKPGAARAQILNKIGITELQSGRLPKARKAFEHSFKANPEFPEPYNNLGAVYYEGKKYDKAIKYYKKAIALQEPTASFHANLGTAYFAKKEFQNAVQEYARALQIDPTCFQRRSQIGIAAQLSSPEDRAHYSYVLAKMYAQAGMLDQALLYLRHAMEDGYKNINDVFTDNEFAGLRKDPRFNELMTQRPPSIPQ